MSFFLNQPLLTNGNVDPLKLQLAEVQYDALDATLRVVRKQCALKCIPAEYGEGDLNKGEMVCVDRCVAKFMLANRIVGAVAQQRGFDATDLRHIEEIKKKYLSAQHEGDDRR